MTERTARTAFWPQARARVGALAQVAELADALSCRTAAATDVIVGVDDNYASAPSCPRPQRS